MNDSENRIENDASSSAVDSSLPEVSTSNDIIQQQKNSVDLSKQTENDNLEGNERSSKSDKEILQNTSRSSRRNRYHSRSHSRSRSHHRRHHSSRRRSHSRSRSREKTKKKNTLFDVIKNVEATMSSQKEGTIPNFNFIEPRYPYGKDLYVGNITEGCYPEDVVAFLNKAMKAANLNKWPGDPVLSCRILPKFCFVSLRHEDEATAALNMDGIYFHGQRLKLNRPVDYSGPITDHQTWQEICPDITWNEMYEVTGVDYKWVLKELEEFPQEVVSLCTGSDESSLTPYLEISNLVTSYDVDAIHDQEELITEFREEFQKYGNVKSVYIPSSKTDFSEKVYIEYETVEEAKKAFKALWSRMFDNRLLGINFFSKQQLEIMVKQLSDN